MDLIQLNLSIRDKIKEIEEHRKAFRNVIEKKANNNALYDKNLAIAILKLRNGVSFEIEGQKIVNPPVSITEKIAKGICWKDKLEVERADAEYKALFTSIDTLKTEINGLQSIIKHMDEI